MCLKSTPKKKERRKLHALKARGLLPLSGDGARRHLTSGTSQLSESRALTKLAAHVPSTLNTKALRAHFVPFPHVSVTLWPANQQPPPPAKPAIRTDKGASRTADNERHGRARGRCRGVGAGRRVSKRGGAAENHLCGAASPQGGRVRRDGAEARCGGCGCVRVGGGGHDPGCGESSCGCLGRAACCGS